MNLKLHTLERVVKIDRARDCQRGIALVVTLLMLSVITFLAVAFLAMSRRDRAAVTATMDVDGARNMSEAALNRAQAEIIAQMMARGDALSYDYMVTHNYISPAGFVNKNAYFTNVNYDYFFNSPGSPVGNNATAWAQNIANLYYDPRPPVFVPTNSPNGGVSNDFRFWVDINRNGRFETNGYLPYIMENGLPSGTNEYFNGEPEWIGVLRDPLNRHSYTNQFIGRYAYMVLPIGKTLDLNYIHNWLKGMYSDKVTTLTNNFLPYVSENSENMEDGFARDAGMGSWELNLAAMLDVLSTNAYEIGFPKIPLGFGIGAYKPTPYAYYPPSGVDPLANTGSAFADAESIVHYRYYPPFSTPPSTWRPTTSPSYFLGSLQEFNLTNLAANNIYCVVAPATNDYNRGLYPAQPPQPITDPWPGSYTTNMFYDPQDLFDPTKTSPAFTNRLLLAGTRTNSEDRYTFERLLANIGTGSAPEYGVWVYGDSNQLVLRTKVNINYNNTAQITNGPYSPMPTNLVNWTPLGFFTNAAELLLRSQSYTYTVSNNLVASGSYTTNLCFGVTNIPIFRFYYPGIQYNDAVHRMLQLAANIYSATVSSNYAPSPTSLASTGPLPPVRHPFVFRPLFQIVGTQGQPGWGVNIVGFTNVVDASVAFNQIQKPFLDLTSNNFSSGIINTTTISPFGNSDNLSGIPWVLSAEKGLPQFYQYSYDNRIIFERKVLFVRGTSGGLPDTNHPPAYTNQFYCMAISNSFGMGAWNPYTTPFTGSLATGAGGTEYYVSNYVTIELTNNYKYGFVTNLTITPAFTSGGSPTLSIPFQWKAWSGNLDFSSNTNGFVTFCNTNIVTVPFCYFSENSNPKQLIFFTNSPQSSNEFLSVDMTQNSGTGWPVHNWTLTITNHVVYALFDGAAQTGNAVLDFVNLGPFGSSISITQQVENVGGTTPTFASDPWAIGRATDFPGSPMSAGLLNQIASGATSDSEYDNSLTGTTTASAKQYTGFVFGPPYNPSNAFLEDVQFVANDPLVHYTTGDLFWGDNLSPLQAIALLFPLTNAAGKISARYQPWGRGDGNQSTDMLFKDPLITSSSAWRFPTNKFPSIGWLGRVHRGTPWQTVYFKSDNPSGGPESGAAWTNWANSAWNPNTQPDTYPTNDWALPDLFTTAPNDNAARGLLSVNQTNDAAWAAVLAGVIMPTNGQGVPIDPTNVYAFVDGPGGINETRTNEPNGLFHKLGYILKTPALTVSNLLAGNVSPADSPYSDEVEERIPQQILGLLKVGEPQFVIYSWGESLRPKNIYLGSPNTGLCTNYEITGEFLSRTVCHVVHTNGPPKMVIDSYNIEPSN
jgi:hypothetical protein